MAWQSALFSKVPQKSKEIFERCENGLEKLLGPDNEDTKSARRWVVKAKRKVPHGNVSD